MAVTTSGCTLTLGMPICALMTGSTITGRWGCSRSQRPTMRMMPVVGHRPTFTAVTGTLSSTAAS